MQVLVIFGKVVGPAPDLGGAVNRGDVWNER
jgi:hypothetical protein